MKVKRNNFIFSESFNDLYTKFDKSIPSTLLISDKFINNINNNNVIKLLEVGAIKWIIIVGKNAMQAADDLDFSIEMASVNNENFFDIVTTSFAYDEIDEIVVEFLISSKLDFEDYQFLSIFINFIVFC